MKGFVGILLFVGTFSTFATGTATPLISSASRVMVNGGAAQVYGDKTYARETGTLTDGNNSFDVSATSSAGIQDTANLMVNLPATVTPLYDANGNLISGGGRSFEYDDENQLKAVQVAGAWRSEFVYDGFGRMRKCIEKTWNGTAFVQGSETRYIYDGMRVIQERDENNNPLVTYTRGLDLSGSLGGAGGIGGLLARTDASGTAYYHSDLGGNVTAVGKEIVDQLGVHSHVLVAKYLYDPYGNILGQWGPLADANKYRFSSKEFHGNSGLYYYGYRFYEPNLQRWLNRDPIGELGGVNLYGFAYNNPVNNIDTDGRLVFSLGFLALDAWTLGRNLANGTANLSDGLWVAADLASVAADIFTGGLGGSEMQAALAGARGVRAARMVNGLKRVSDADAILAGVQGIRVAMTHGSGGPCPGPSPLAAKGGVSLADDLAAAASRARNTVGPGSGGAYGTRVHSAFEAEVNGLGRGLQTEVSYLNGDVVRRGTPGSVRLDVVNGPLNAPASIFDLKTGSATLTPGRIQQIQSHVPGGSGVPVFEVRP